MIGPHDVKIKENMHICVVTVTGGYSDIGAQGSLCHLLSRRTVWVRIIRKHLYEHHILTYFIPRLSCVYFCNSYRMNEYLLYVYGLRYFDSIFVSLHFVDI